MPSSTHGTGVPLVTYLMFFGAGFVLLATLGCRVTDLPLWRSAAAPPCFIVEKIGRIDYRDGPGGKKHHDKLDLFVPKGKKDCPVVLLVHGGAWMMGDNRCCGLYSSLGEFLASQGFIAVLPNYRLSPLVKHPEHIKDVACAFAWLHAHIEEYGGRRDQIFLMGHSAGGHLVSLLATDEQYLKAKGLGSKNIRGVISISGVYHIPPGKIDFTLGGPGDDSFRLDKMVPLRSPNTRSKFHLPGIPVTIDFFEPTFGIDPTVREKASPIHHVRPGLPPFLLFYADNDLPLLPDMARDFHQALRDKGCDSQLILVPQRNHNSIMFQAFQSNDPVAQAAVEFIRAKIVSYSEIKGGLQ